MVETNIVLRNNKKKNIDTQSTFPWRLPTCCVKRLLQAQERRQDVGSVPLHHAVRVLRERGAHQAAWGHGRVVGVARYGDSNGYF